MTQILLFTLSFLAADCRSATTPATHVQFFEPATSPEGFLPRSSKPEDLGIDRPALEALVAQAESSHSHALIVIKDGRVVAERYFGHAQQPLRLNSVTKSVVSLAIGMLIKEGKISSVNAPLSTWLSQFKEGDRAKITLWNILTHTSGLYHEQMATKLYQQPDVVKYALGLPLAEAPGRSFSYSNEAVALLAGVVSAAAGKPLDAYLQEKLFTPMGILGCDWDRDPAGNPMAYGGLWMLPRDLARIGLLMLDSGRWKGGQLLSESWVRSATSPARGDITSYGLLWWLNGGQDFAAGFSGGGWLGQYVVVYPKSRLVAVRLHGVEAGNDADEQRAYGFEGFSKQVLTLVRPPRLAQEPQGPPRALSKKPRASAAQLAKLKIEWIMIPGGNFMMGANDEGPGARPHQVTLHAFEMAKTLVTKAQYQACVDAGSCEAPKCGWPAAAGEDDSPVGCVDWYDARQFSDWVGGRLPSEAEWEYAARSAGQDQKYPWGNEDATCERAIIREGGRACGRDGVWPVCSKPEGNTKQGLCDMAGIVWQWVQDSEHGSYDGAPSDGSAWEDPAGKYRCRRGGGLGAGVGIGRAAHRDGGDPGNHFSDLGLRPVRESRD